MAGCKIFVGSLPDHIAEGTLRAEFGKFGTIRDLFVKTGCETGRQWAMITYSAPTEAEMAKKSTDRILQLPGTDKAVEVMIARNQPGTAAAPAASLGVASGAGATDLLGALGALSPSALALAATDLGGGGSYLPRAADPTATQPRKIFVGSLPNDITAAKLQAAFEQYGRVVDVFLKSGAENNKQWAFVTYASTEEAEFACSKTDKLLRFEGSDLLCEVMLARNQGMNGRDPLRPGSAALAVGSGSTQRKLFVGSLPDDITELALRNEFSKYGQILDVFVKTGCENNKQWAFIVFGTNAEAQLAKDSADRVLVFPGSVQPVAVMFAKGQESAAPAPAVSQASVNALALGGVPLGQPAPPPLSTLPPHCAWKSFQTPHGLTYYHNVLTGATQWDCPPELIEQQAQAQAAAAVAALNAQHVAVQQQQAAAAATSSTAAAVPGQQPAAQPGFSMASMYGAMYGAQPGANLYQPY